MGGRRERAAESPSASPPAAGRRGSCAASRGCWSRPSRRSRSSSSTRRPARRPAPRRPRPAPATSSRSGAGSPPRATARSPSAPAGVLAVTDDDCVPDPGWIAGLAAALTRPPAPAAVRAPILPPARRAAARHLRHLPPRVARAASTTRPGPAVGRRQRGELRGARRGPPGARRLGRAARHGLARPRGRGRRPPLRLLRGGGTVRYEPSAVVRHEWQPRARRYATRWSYAYGVGTMAGLWLARGEPEAARWLAGYARMHVRPLLGALRRRDRDGLRASTPARSAGCAAGRRPRAGAPDGAAMTALAREHRDVQPQPAGAARRHGALRPRDAPGAGGARGGRPGRRARRRDRRAGHGRGCRVGPRPEHHARPEPRPQHRPARRRAPDRGPAGRRHAGGARMAGAARDRRRRVAGTVATGRVLAAPPEDGAAALRPPRSSPTRSRAWPAARSRAT